jgi:hypothetical protein
MGAPLIVLFGQMDDMTKSVGTFREYVNLKLRTINKIAMISTTNKLEARKDINILKRNNASTKNIYNWQIIFVRRTTNSLCETP